MIFLFRSWRLTTALFLLPFFCKKQRTEKLVLFGPIWLFFDELIRIWWPWLPWKQNKRDFGNLLLYPLSQGRLSVFANFSQNVPLCLLWEVAWFVPEINVPLVDVFCKIRMQTEGPSTSWKMLLINSFLPLPCPPVGYCCCRVLPAAVKIPLPCFLSF